MANRPPVTMPDSTKAKSLLMRRSIPGRRRRPRGDAGISSGLPSASRRPRFNTTTLLHSRMTKAMSCSTSSTPHEFSSRMRSRAFARWSISRSSRPEVGSSSSSTRGLVHDRAGHLQQPESGQWSDFRPGSAPSIPDRMPPVPPAPLLYANVRAWREGKRTRSAKTPPPPPRHSTATIRLSSTVR